MARNASRGGTWLSLWHKIAGDSNTWILNIISDLGWSSSLIEDLKKEYKNIKILTGCESLSEDFRSESDEERQGGGHRDGSGETGKVGIVNWNQIFMN